MLRNRLYDVVCTEPLRRGHQVLHLTPDIRKLRPVVVIRRNAQNSADHAAEFGRAIANVQRDLKNRVSHMLRRVMADRDVGGPDREASPLGKPLAVHGACNESVRSIRYAALSTSSSARSSVKSNTSWIGARSGFESL